MPSENSGKFDTRVDEGVRKSLRIDERHDRVDGVSRRDVSNILVHLAGFYTNGYIAVQMRIANCVKVDDRRYELSMDRDESRGKI